MKTPFTCDLFHRAILALVAILALASAGRAAPIRVLILSGQNVHDWKATTPYLEKLYNGSERFRVVRVVDNVASLGADGFAGCDVIVSNWTCHPQMTGGPFSLEGKKAFEDAIRSGVGMVSFHAACTACNDWADFQQISGLTWKWEFTNHTAYHTFKVRVRDPSHPVTQGMPDFWTTDELYQRMVKMTPASHQLLADAWAEPQFGGVSGHEPMLIATQLGKGRGINLLLGHDVRAMQNPAFQTIMLRSAEWAATGKVTLPIPEDWPGCAAAAAVVGVDPDSAIQAATLYAPGGPYAPLFTVEQLIIAACSRTGEKAAAGRAALAAKLANAIAAGRTPEAKAFFCKMLANIGTPREVSAVAPLLLDEQTQAMARFALERIPGPAAAEALRGAVGKARGSLLVGIVTSIGAKADPDAVAVLEPLLRDADPAVIETAIAAIGGIGTARSADSLRGARANAAPALRAAYDDALLSCAQKMLDSGDKAGASLIYLQMYGPAESGLARAAGLQGLVRVDPRAAPALVKESLVSETPEVRAMAWALVRARPKEAVTVIADALASAGGVDRKRRALELLGSQASTAALELAMTALKDADLAEDAGMAAARIAGALDNSHRAIVRGRMKEVLAVCRSAGTREMANGVLRELSRPINLARQAEAGSPDGIDSDGAAGGDAAAIDGDPATYWDETDNQKLYILKLTWKTPIQCNAILIKGHAFESHCPRRFDIVCDGKVVRSVDNAVYDRKRVEASFEFRRTRCTGLELRITGWYGGSPGVRELEVYDIADDDAAASQPAAAPAFRWQRTDDSVALFNHNNLVWQFNHARNAGIPCFHPVNLVDGTELVWLNPPDHPHHRALWFAWKLLNGVNYWEHSPDSGVTEVTGAGVTTRPDFSAQIDLSLSYHPAGKPAVLTETRTLRISPPAADGSYRIDWDSTFTAGSEEVELRGGTAGGGYAGLSVRISGNSKEWEILDSEGRLADKPPADGMPRETHGQHARWSDFSFVSTTTQTTAGVTLFDHPANLRYPSYWHDCMYWNARFGYLSPAPLWSEPYTLAANRKLSLRYRILLHPGRPDSERLEREFKAFIDG